MKLAATVPVDTTLMRLQSTAARRDAADLATQLLRLQTWLSDELAAVAAALDAAVATGDAGAHDAGRYLLSLGGKRLRPLVTLLAARLFADATPAAAIDYAAAAELVHAATLLHDDVIDDARMRRGRASANRVYGNAVSILGGDHLLVAALCRVQQHGQGQVLATLLQTLDHMVAAEALQLDQRDAFAVDHEAYWHVVEGKTAGLFAWAFAAGGSAAGCGDHDAERLAAVGRYVGVAFQLLDDLIDLTGDTVATGKAALADVREGKRTWPLILAAERDAFVRRQLARYAASGDDPDPVAAAELVAAVAATGAFDATRLRAATAAVQAQAILAELPDSPVRQSIDDLIAALLERDA